ncbi:RING-box protein 1 [Babesia caballi]|uniref:RING-box protein 1 n=1 Tax=Babesia caballi TaxID=5871 RepID=A0AAV4LMZ2_BABCB|nr:RING-box protein 1 [Babesia caballi]
MEVDLAKPRFTIKKWSAVALWTWNIAVDNCAICRNHIMDLCIECQVGPPSVGHRAHPTLRRPPEARTRPATTTSAPSPGASAATPSTSTASPSGSRPGTSAPSTTPSGTSPPRRRRDSDANVRLVVENLVYRALDRRHQRVALVDGEGEAREPRPGEHRLVLDVGDGGSAQLDAREGATLQFERDPVLQRGVEDGAVVEVPPEGEERHHERQQEHPVVGQRRVQALEGPVEDVRLRHEGEGRHQARDQPEGQQRQRLAPEEDVVGPEPALGHQAHDGVHREHVVHVHGLREEVEAEGQRRPVDVAEVRRVGQRQDHERLEEREPQRRQDVAPELEGVVQSAPLPQARAHAVDQPVGPQRPHQRAQQVVNRLGAPGVVEDGVARQQRVRQLAVQDDVEHQREGREAQVDDLLAPRVEDAHSAEARVEVVDDVDEAEAEVAEDAKVEQKGVFAQRLAAVDEEQLAQEPELADGEVRRPARLAPLAAVDAHPHVGRQDHVNVVGSVSDGERRAVLVELGVVPRQLELLLVRRAAGDHHPRELRQPEEALLQRLVCVDRLQHVPCDGHAKPCGNVLSAGAASRPLFHGRIAILLHLRGARAVEQVRVQLVPHHLRVRVTQDRVARRLVQNLRRAPDAQRRLQLVPRQHPDHDPRLLQVADHVAHLLLQQVLDPRAAHQLHVALQLLHHLGDDLFPVRAQPQRPRVRGVPRPVELRRQLPHREDQRSQAHRRELLQLPAHLLHLQHLLAPQLLLYCAVGALAERQQAAARVLDHDRHAPAVRVERYGLADREAHCRHQPLRTRRLPQREILRAQHPPLRLLRHQRHFDLRHRPPVREHAPQPRRPVDQRQLVRRRRVVLHRHVLHRDQPRHSVDLLQHLLGALRGAAGVLDAGGALFLVDHHAVAQPADQQELPHHLPQLGCVRRVPLPEALRPLGARQVFAPAEPQRPQRHDVLRQRPRLVRVYVRDERQVLDQLVAARHRRLPVGDHLRVPADLLRLRHPHDLPHDDEVHRDHRHQQQHHAPHGHEQLPPAGLVGGQVQVRVDVRGRQLPVDSQHRRGHHAAAHDDEHREQVALVHALELRVLALRGAHGPLEQPRLLAHVDRHAVGPLRVHHRRPPQQQLVVLQVDLVHGHPDVREARAQVAAAHRRRVLQSADPSLLHVLHIVLAVVCHSRKRVQVVARRLAHDLDLRLRRVLVVAEQRRQLRHHVLVLHVGLSVHVLGLHVAHAVISAAVQQHQVGREVLVRMHLHDVAHSDVALLHLHQPAVAEHAHQPAVLLLVASPARQVRRQLSSQAHRDDEDQRDQVCGESVGVGDLLDQLQKRHSQEDEVSHARQLEQHHARQERQQRVLGRPDDVGPPRAAQERQAVRLVRRGFVRHVCVERVAAQEAPEVFPGSSPLLAREGILHRHVVGLVEGPPVLAVVGH